MKELQFLPDTVSEQHNMVKKQNMLHLFSQSL